MGRNNNAPAWGVPHTVQELQRLLKSGIIGLYNSFEITEVFGFQRGQDPTNFLTLAVAEPAEPPATGIPERPFLNQGPLVLRSTDWKVGVARYRIPPQALMDALNRFSQTGVWKAGHTPLRVGTLAAVTPQFVPANSYQEHPWNRVLKNNFWEGSHVLELFDTSKQNIRFLLEDSKTLTNLAEIISTYAPLGMDGLSDRLGNILIQLPVTVISTAMRGSERGARLRRAPGRPGVKAPPLVGQMPT